MKKMLKPLLTIFVLFLGFSFWMSPRLGGMIPMGKDKPDQKIEALKFDTLTGNGSILKYKIERSEKLEQLRKEFQLDSIIKSCKSDFDKVIKIQSWVQSRWKHDGDNSAEKSDALYILKEAEKGKRFRCVEYSIVATQCLQSLGFIVRPLGLMTKDVNDVKSGAGHVANEVYLNDLQKWVFIDPQFDVITTLTGVPLNAVELQDAIAKNKHFEIINPNKTTTEEEYKKWIGPYLYYFNVSINNQKISIWDRIIGNKKQLTLLSVTATEPTYFQKIMRIRTSNYTNSISDFYPKLAK